MPIRDAVLNAVLAIGRFARVAYEHPDWTVERNDQGNWALVDAKGQYQGFVDFRNGEVVLT